MSEGIDLAPDKDASPQEVQGANKWLTGTEVGDRRAADVNIVGSITADVNLAEVAGTATSVNTGNSDNGTQRVVLATDQPAVRVRGAIAEGAAASGANPVTIAGKDVFGNVAIPTLLQAAGVFNLTAVINADTDGTTQDYRSTGEAYALVGSTDGTKANANFLLFDSLRRANIAGQVAHDAANTGNPVVVGSEAIADPLSVSAVSAGDATKHYADLVGRQYNVNFAFHRNITTELNALETTFNNTTVLVNSSDIVSNGFRKCQLGFTAAFANTPTAIFIYVQTKFPSGTYRTREDGYLGQWSYTRAIITSKPEICCEFDINCDTFRIQIEATGTTASNTFTLTNVEAILTT
jgi:hypothetical protein